jgi:hypothetical protein
VWEKIPLKFQDVEAITELLGGDLVPTAADRTRRRPRAYPPAIDGGFMVAEIAGAAPGTETLPAGSGGGLVPDAVQSILGVRADNSLLVYGTSEDIQSLRSLIRMIDLPQRQVRLRISAGKLTAEGQVLNGSRLQLSDSAGADRVSVTLTPRLLGDGSIEVALEGSVVAAGASRPLRSQVRLAPGRTVQVVTLGQIALSVRADVIP